MEKPMSHDQTPPHREKAVVPREVEPKPTAAAADEQPTPEEKPAKSKK